MISHIPYDGTMKKTEKKNPCRNNACSNIEKLNAKLQAIRNLNLLIFREKKNKWEAIDICRSLADGNAYLSCWMASTDGSGLIKEFAHTGNSQFLPDSEGRKNDSTLSDFIKNAVKRADIMINEAPLPSAKNHENEIDRPGTMTTRIEYNNHVYGVLSVSVHRGEEMQPEQQLLFTEVANDIALEYYNIEMEANQNETLERLHQSEKFYRTIFETTGNATILIDEDTTINYANIEFEKLSAYGREEIEGKMSWQDFIAKEDLEMMREYHRIRRINSDAAPRNYEFHFIDRYNNIKDIYGTFDIIPDTKKSIASFMDITEQKMLESHIIRISEQERQKIGNDLHDGLGPHLVGVKFMMNLLEKKLKEKHLIDEAKDVEEINALITQGINHTRRLVKGLCPVDIDTDGLIVALEDLTSNIEKVFSIKCTFEHDDSLHITENITTTHLYLIAQEAVNNAIKHSRADKIDVAIFEKDGFITLQIRDNGIGIEKLLDRKKGMGINIMKYRARVINAALDIRPNMDRGTSVSCLMKKHEINAPRH